MKRLDIRFFLKLSHFFMAGFLAFICISCSGQQQVEEDLEATSDDFGSDDAAEGNGQENHMGNSGNEFADQTAGSASLNSDTTSEDESFNSMLSNQPPATDNMGTPPPVPDPIMNTPAPAPAPVAAAPSGSAPIPGGRVRYVPEGGVEVVNAPGGSPVTTLTQGEHPLTWEESGWLRISQGMYVPNSAMQTKGVPRPASGPAWH